MLAIKQHTFSEKDLESFLLLPQTMAFFEQLKLTMDGVLATFRVVAEKSCWDIDSILNEAIQNIEDESLRNVFRRFLVSQKYGISPWYCGQQYSVCKVSDNSVLVDTPLQTVANKECKIGYTIFLSPQGDIKVPESEKIWVFDTLKHGFHVVGKGKSGIYTWTGNVLFPCIFDAVDNGWPAETIEYKGDKYVFTICGTSLEVNPTMFRDDKTISFCCEDKVYSIAPLGENYSQNNLDELREIMYSLHDKKQDNIDNEQTRNGRIRLDSDEWREIAIRSELTGREKCQETIAGYIRLMQANDKPVFINTKFIVYVEPTKIARYHYTEGSLVTLSVSGLEGLQTIKVIEPCEVVMKAIEESVKD